MRMGVSCVEASYEPLSLSLSLSTCCSPSASEDLASHVRTRSFTRIWNGFTAGAFAQRWPPNQDKYVETTVGAIRGDEAKYCELFCVLGMELCGRRVLRAWRGVPEYVLLSSMLFGHCHAHGRHRQPGPCRLTQPWPLTLAHVHGHGRHHGSPVAMNMFFGR